MKLSPYFSDLRSAYDAELDDLASDSEGKDVLKRRLAAKRSEIGFLVQMIDLSPEMVAVVFHRGFRYLRPAAIERLLGLRADGLPAWPELAHAVALEPWAQAAANVVLAQPGGPAFLTVAACLDYLHAHGPGDGGVQEAQEDDAEESQDGAHLSADDAIEPQEERSLDEAGADWLAEQGFERKE